MTFILANDNEDELTGDNRALFSEVQLGGDSAGSISNANALDNDVRSSHSPSDEQRESSALSTRSRSIVPEDKVMRRIPINDFFICLIF